MSKFHRRGRRDTYTARHEAKCLSCGEPTTFWRHPNDRQCGRVGHKKYLHCYGCKRSTLHVQVKA